MGQDVFDFQCTMAPDLVTISDRTTFLMNEVASLRRDVNSLKHRNGARDTAHDDLAARVHVLGKSVGTTAEEQAQSAQQLLAATKELRLVAETVGSEVCELKSNGEKRDR